MRKITEIKEIQKIELDMMAYVDQFCRENNLTYYLAYGTLIGAVRHKGFIPWDDDIDIVLPRDDYEKFLKLFGSGNDTYGMVCVENSKNDYNYPWAKVYDKRTKVIEEDKFQKEDFGLWIDIFPIDGLGENEEEAIEMAKKIRVNKYRIWTMHAFAKKGIKGRLMNLIGRKNFNKIMTRDAKKNDFYTAKYVGCIIGNNEKEVIEGKYWREKIEMDFEGHKFYVPKGYDEILTKCYGEYMTLPPENARDTGHSMDVCWR